MRRGFLVYGSESSGCRWLTRLFIAAGCCGDRGHEQRLEGDFGDDERRKALELDADVVWRHSIPHHGDWPNISSHIKVLTESGREVKVFVIVRDWWPMAHSQLANKHVDNIEQALINARKAYASALSSLVTYGCWFHLVTYEAFILHPAKSISTLMKLAGLPEPQQYEEIKNENTKWYS